jgi:hypothetical protein
MGARAWDLRERNQEKCLAIFFRDPEQIRQVYGAAWFANFPHKLWSLHIVNPLEETHTWGNVAVIISALRQGGVSMAM